MLRMGVWGFCFLLGMLEIFIMNIFLKKPFSQRPFLFIFANYMWFPPFPRQLWLRVRVICPGPSHSKSSALSTSQVLLLHIFFFIVLKVLKKSLFICILWVWMLCLHLWMCGLHMVPGSHRARRGCWIPWDWSFGWL